MTRRKNSSPQSLAVLAVLLEQPREWIYGYELSKRTSLKSGTLYPLLIRLFDQGLLEDGWKESGSGGRPPRHMYRLTPAGLEMARRMLDSARDDIHTSQEIEVTG